VYGRAESEALVTEESPVHPLTAYAISKVRTEEELARLADETFCPVFLRNATAYGWSPCFRADLVLNNLACWAYTTGEIRILSDGTPWRPLVHVQEIARAFLTLLAAPLDRIHNQVINIGAAGQNYRVSELSILVQQAFPGSGVSYVDGGGPDPRSYRVDFAKSAELLPKYQPSWEARSGAEQLCRAFTEVDLRRDEITGPRYTRLARLKELIDAGQLDDTLRWVV
jgi:nucleoside-diphosphate-sugar epimerase